MKSIRRPLLAHRFEPAVANLGAVLVPSWMTFSSSSNALRTAQTPFALSRLATSTNYARFEDFGVSILNPGYPGFRGLAMEATGDNVLASSSLMTDATAWDASVGVTIESGRSFDAAGRTNANKITPADNTCELRSLGATGGAASKVMSVWARQTGTGGGFKFFEDGGGDASDVFVPDGTWRRYSWKATTTTQWCANVGQGTDATAPIQFCYAQLDTMLPYAQSTLGPTQTGTHINTRSADKLVVSPSVAGDANNPNGVFASGRWDIDIVFFPLYNSSQVATLSTQHTLFFIDQDNRVYVDTDYTVKMSSGVGTPDTLSVGPISVSSMEGVRVKARSTSQGRSLEVSVGAGPVVSDVSSTPSTAFDISNKEVYVCGQSGSDGADQSCLLWYFAIYNPVVP